ncbi:MalY/PatB family protein [Leifsonia shinshuensis]|uniref:cysteine-S-conjugate beta-lyase n=1 Tax=Leifsonia shinshuensis TaxID=150026 RepID=A0A853CXC2_9MICO|nr:aminotransferase class I/II-fold pyridoxal phosphate-dependent enzyme [Leifsonia shinshuensis]NYJ23824.1 cystathionine beta-lyase [Leifsonia shinshuensis]
MSFAPARPLEQLFASRSSIKWRRYPADVLPVFVAEMDFDVEPAILDRVADTLRNSDTGYLDSAGPLAPAFADFAWSSWAWGVDPQWVHLATDVTVGVVETLRLVLPESGGRVVLTPPVYPPFFEMIEEADAVAITVPLREDAGWTLDLDALETAFAAGVDAMLLCNPQNPTGRCHSRRSLEALARLAARYGVFVVSDEVHAPLAHPGVRFTPFAPVARAAGARAVTVTSASKAWNLAGLKCAVIVAAEPATADLLTRLPEELAARTSILGLHANVAALSCLRWRDGLLEQLVENLRLLEAELTVHAPAVRVVRPDAGYLAWLDFRDTGLGDDPARVLIDTGRVALNSGLAFGEQGRGFARINLACDPSTVVEAVRRIAATVAAYAPVPA